jgi:hypothetical protein
MVTISRIESIFRLVMKQFFLVFRLLSKIIISTDDYQEFTPKRQNNRGFIYHDVYSNNIEENYESTIR